MECILGWQVCYEPIQGYCMNFLQSGMERRIFKLAIHQWRGMA